jgi:hypothetical protein
MSIFTGTLNYTSKLHYLFTTDNQDFIYIGLPQFTLPSLYSHCKNNYIEIEQTSINSTLKTLFVSAKDNNQQDFLQAFYGIIQSRYYYKFNLSSKTFEKETIDNDKMIDLINKFEVLKTKENHTDEDTLNSVREIQNSSYGYLQLDSTINEILGGESFPINLRLYFKDNTDALTGERVLAHKASNLVTGVPRRSTGAKYGAKNTNNPKDKQNNIGFYSSPSENDDKNVTNMVSGPLKMSFNKSLGVWESGTQQILAKLLTDIDKANIKNVTVALTDTAEDKNFYLADSDNYMGEFTTGVAMPLSIEDGNPHLFGPNCITCGDEKKIEKIRVVNRSLRSFKSGSIVMCSHIDGEWIVQGFDAPQPLEPQSATLKVGRWSFTKLLANSDVLFKDDRESNRRSITPTQYENSRRIQYYRHMLQLGGDENTQPAITNEDIKKWSNLNDLNTIAKLNINIALSEEEALKAPLPESSSYDIVPNTKYVQSTIFDQLGNGLGGSNSANLIGRTNVYHSPSTIIDEFEEAKYSQMPVFWGTVFPDGYSAAQVYALKNRPNKAFIPYPLGATNAQFLRGSDGTKIFSKSTEDNLIASENLFMFADDTDYNLRQLPAEVALNGSFDGKYSYPIESLKSLVKAEIENKNLLDCYTQFLNDKNRYTWLANAASSGNLFALDPVSPNVIQFSPLQAEFAISADDEFAGQKPKFNEVIQRAFSKPVGNLFGDMFSREEGDGLRPDLFKVTSKGNKTIYYGEYVKFPGTAPLGGPLIFSETSGSERSNLVGIIAARNKFSAQKGGTINLTTNQYFGLTPRTTVSGGQVTPISVIPLGGGIVLGGSQNAFRDRSVRQWGSLADSYNDFGTTALHVRIFDQWPDEQTIYDPRYFAILHFNPFNSSGIGGNVGSDIKNAGIVYEGDWDPKTDPAKYNTSSLSSAKYEKSVDKSITSVDFRIPTAGHPSDSQIDNQPIPVDAIINRYGWTSADNNTAENLKAVLRPELEWRINPIRRGQLLTGGGFRYYKRVIGINKGEIENGGEGYAINDELTFAKEAKAIVKSVSSTGAITSIEFKDSNGNKTYGAGFLPSDFASIVRHKSDNSVNGKNAKIKVETGIVYDKLMLDSSPQDRIQSIPRLTIGSDDGYSVAQGQFNTKLTLIENNDGKYEAFYFFHNDIMHTILYETGGFINGDRQYVVLEISAG